VLKWLWGATEPEPADGGRRMKRYWDKVLDEWVYEAYDMDVTDAPEDNEQVELSEGKEEEKNLVLLLSSLR
jgi:hypothetical protein